MTDDREKSSKSFECPFCFGIYRSEEKHHALSDQCKDLASKRQQDNVIKLPKLLSDDKCKSLIKWVDSLTISELEDLQTQSFELEQLKDENSKLKSRDYFSRPPCVGCRNHMADTLRTREWCTFFDIPFNSISRPLNSKLFSCAAFEAKP